MSHADGGGPVDPDRDPAVGGDDLFVPPGAGRRRARGGARGTDVRLVLGGVVACAAMLALGIGVGASLDRPEPTAAAVAPRPVVTVTATPAPQPAAGPVPEPARVEIPSIGVDAPLIDLFVAEDGTMGVPSTAEQVGWWEDGPLPGEPGASLIAAHVSLGGQDGAFAALDEVAVGDEVTVDRVDGSVATYAVTSVEQFPKDDFPDDRVYTFEGPTRLHLVTCGGVVDPDTGHFEDNVVVFADLVSDTRSPTDA